MHRKILNISISNNSNTRNEQFSGFEELFDNELQQIEQERLLQQEIK
jgi:hypothetical protein